MAFVDVLNTYTEAIHNHTLGLRKWPRDAFHKLSMTSGLKYFEKMYCLIMK